MIFSITGCVMRLQKEKTLGAEARSIFTTNADYCAVHTGPIVGEEIEPTCRPTRKRRPTVGRQNSTCRFSCGLRKSRNS